MADNSISVQGATKEFVIDVSVKMKDDLKKITDGIKKLDSQIEKLGLNTVANAQGFQKAGVKLDDWSKVVKSTDQIMFEFNREMAQIGAQAQALPNKINSLKTALSQLATAGKQNTAEFAAYQNQLNRLTGGTSQFGTGIQSLRGQVQNASFQITDFIVSVQGGTKASVALGQQLPQLLGAFGAWGAALGLVASLLGPFIARMFEAATPAKKLGEIASDLSTNINSLGTAFNKVNTDQLVESFNKASAAARNLMRESTQAQLAILKTDIVRANSELQSAMKKQLENAKSDLLSGWKDFTFLPQGTDFSADAIGLRKFADATGYTVKEAQKVVPILKNLSNGAINSSEAVNQITRSVQVMSPALGATTKELLNLSLQQEEAKRTADALEKTFKDMGKAGPVDLIPTGKSTGGGGASAVKETSKLVSEQTKAVEKLRDEYLSMYEAIRTPEEKRAELLAKISEFTKADIGNPEIIKRIYDKAIADTADEITKSTIKWKEALVTSGQEIDNTAPKIEFLRTTIANLQATGQTDTGYFRVLTEELQKLDPMIQTISKEFDNMAEKLKSSTSPAEDFNKAVQELTDTITIDSVASLNLYIEKLAKLRDAYDQATKDNTMLKLLNDINNKVGNTLTGAFDSLIDGIGKTKFSITDFATSFLKDIAKMITQLLIVKPLVEALGNSLKGFGVDQFGANSNGRIMPSAKGNTFNSLGLPQGVINQPIMFPMKGAGLRAFAKGGAFGAGVAGEAGPEAIVPLRRTRSGDLGVQGSPVNVIINNNASQDVEVTANSYTGPDMQTVLEVQIARKVRTMVSDGSLDSQFRSSFNLRRSAA
jgi:hypothetical protein